MAFNHLQILKLSLTISTILTIFNTPTSQQNPTIYQILETHNLPIGIFPKGISDFTINPSTGQFEFNLSTPSPCDAEYETSVRYESRVSGVIGYGKIEELKGVAAQELFIWLPVNGVRVDVPSSGLIYFDVGVISKQFSMSYFEAPRECVVSGDDRVEVVDLSFVGLRNPIVQNQPGKHMNENDSAHEQQAVS